jgi:hypothetical protein
MSASFSQPSTSSAPAVNRAHQLEFLVLGDVAEMHGAEFAERDVGADRHRAPGNAA